MKNSKNSVPLSIFLASEIILSLRILLFTVPVLLSRYAGAVPLKTNHVEDFFILLLTCGAVAFTVAGGAAFLNVRLWKAIHYLTAGMILALTCILYQKININGNEIQWLFFLPAALAVLAVIVVGLSKSKG